MENIYIKIGQEVAELSRISLKVNDGVNNKMTIVCNSLGRAIRRNVWNVVLNTVYYLKYDKH
jgi:hypothetical protein